MVDVTLKYWAPHLSMLKMKILIDPVFYQPIYGEFNGSERDASHRLDIRLDYFTDIAQYPINVYVDILNIYGHQKIPGR